MEFFMNDMFYVAFSVNSILSLFTISSQISHRVDVIEFSRIFLNLVVFLAVQIYITKLQRNNDEFTIIKNKLDVMHSLLEDIDADLFDEEEELNDSEDAEVTEEEAEEDAIVTGKHPYRDWETSLS